MSGYFIDWACSAQIYCSRKDWNKDHDKLWARGDRERCVGGGLASGEICGNGSETEKALVKSILK